MEAAQTNRVLAELARAHHSLIHRPMALAAGVSHSALTRRVHSGVLEQIGPEVYRISGARTGWHQRALAACWVVGTDALVSHRAAALAWRLDGYPTAPLEVLTERWTRRPGHKGVVVHEAGDILDTDRASVEGLPVTSAVRTVLDLAAVSPPRRVEQAIEDGLRRRLFTSEQLGERFARFDRRGKRGLRILRPLIAERVGPYVPTDSDFELRMVELIREAGLPEPVRQHRVDLDGVSVYLDLSWPELLLFVECDGIFVHSTSIQLRWDDDRQNELVLRGWMPIRVTWHRMVHEPEVVVATLRRAWADRNRPNCIPA